jgi:hypothetical protein
LSRSYGELGIAVEPACSFGLEMIERLKIVHLRGDLRPEVGGIEPRDSLYG